MREEWRGIKDYKGLYQVSNTGNVKSLERTVRCARGYKIVPEKILEGYDNGNGYLYVKLCKEGKRKQYRINRLVAQAFLENPQNLPEVNHKDKNPKNNCVDNLEWCTRQYNVEYSKAKAVIGINKVSGLIVEFPSVMEAERQTDINNKNICACLKGKRKSAGGYYWIYAESEEVCDEQE